MKKPKLIPVGTVMVDTMNGRTVGTVQRSGPTTAWCETKIRLVATEVPGDFASYRGTLCTGHVVSEDHPRVAEIREILRIHRLAEAIQARIPVAWASPLSVGDYAKQYGGTEAEERG